MTSRLIGRFVYGVELATRERYGNGALTRFGANLVIHDEGLGRMLTLKAFAAHFVLFTDERRTVMKRQEEVLHILVDFYRDHPEKLDPDLAADHDAAADDEARLRVVIDQVGIAHRCPGRRPGTAVVQDELDRTALDRLRWVCRGCALPALGRWSAARHTLAGR